MLLPMQSRPVQRTTVGASSVNQTYGTAGGAASATFGRGVEPSGWLDDITNVVRTVGQVAGAAGPILGAFGI